MNVATEKTPAAPTTTRIAIGQRGMFGIYAGITRGVDGGEDARLELLDDTAAKKMTWKEALTWAERLGATLPTRDEAALLFANLRDQVEPDWYWTCEQCESGPSYAWSQSFYDGYQGDGHKAGQLRARAVRRLPLSVI